MPNAKFCNSCPAPAAVVASVDSVLTVTTVPLYYYSIRLNSYPEILLDLFQSCLQGCHGHYIIEAVKTVSPKLFASHLCSFLLSSKGVRAVKKELLFAQFDISQKPIQRCTVCCWRIPGHYVWYTLYIVQCV